MIRLRVLKLRDLADRLDCRLEGDGDVEIRRVAGIEAAEAGDLTFFANPRYTTALRSTRAAAVILADDAPAAPCPMLRTAEPYLAFARAVELFADGPAPAPGIDSASQVAADAKLGDGVSVGPFVFIGSGAVVGPRTVVHPNVTIGAGATIGADCVIHAQAALREGVVLGDRVVVQNGAVIGSDGFGFARRPDGTHQKIPQHGGLVIEDDVEIGALVAIDRPALGETRIAAGAKIDNLVQVGHGVRIGRNALLAAQVGIAGSTVVEDDVVLAGQVGVNGHITIGKGARATGQTGITNDVPPGSFVSGLPAIENRAWRKAASSFVQLPALRKRVAALERRCAELERRGPPSTGNCPTGEDAESAVKPPNRPEPEAAGDSSRDPRAPVILWPTACIDKPTMGEIVAKVELENAGDRALVDSGHGQESQVRRSNIEAIVDTGAIMLVLPQNVVERLGLEQQRTVIVTYADERREERPLAGPVTVRIGNRAMNTDCVVGPPLSEPLIGQIVLEALDLIADCANRTLTPRFPDYPLLKLK